MHAHPLVSVLMPCFRTDDLVTKAVESVLAQSYPHIQLIVVPDDARSYQWLRATFASTRLHILQPSSKPATGVSAARNRAIDIATGDYFLRCDSDDTLEPDLVEQLVHSAASTGCALGPFRYVDEEGNTVRLPQAPPGLVSITGFGQMLCSFSMLNHRRLEPGYRDVFAEDVLHDLHVLGRCGGFAPVVDAGYLALERAGSLTRSSMDTETSIQESYLASAELATQSPTALGLQDLTTPQRQQVAAALRFRHYVSEAFSRWSQGQVGGYAEFVRDREGLLWDHFVAGVDASSPALAA